VREHVRDSPPAEICGQPVGSYCHLIEKTTDGLMIGMASPWPSQWWFFGNVPEEERTTPQDITHFL
jgi:hypothetical protein